MAVAPASLWGPARRNLKARRAAKPQGAAPAHARAVARRQKRLLDARLTPFAKKVSAAFTKLGDSIPIPPEAKASDPAQLPLPGFGEFEASMTRILQQEWLAAGQIGVDGVEEMLGITIEMNLRERIIPKGVIGGRVKDISNTARTSLRDTILQSIEDGVHPSVIARRMREQCAGWAGLEDLSRSRSYTIARTETAMAFNHGTLTGYTESGLVDTVEVFDGSSCGWLTHTDPDLANGKIVTLTEARQHPIAHPNCLRAFGAVVSREAPTTKKPQPAAAPKPPPPTISPAEQLAQLTKEHEALQLELRTIVEDSLSKPGSLPTTEQVLRIGDILARQKEIEAERRAIRKTLPLSERTAARPTGRIAEVSGLPETYDTMYALTDAAEQAYGLTSSWEGKVTTGGLSGETAAVYNWDSTLQVSRVHPLLKTRDRYNHVVLHEATHGVSVGADRGAFADWTGWEEGVVEAATVHNGAAISAQAGTEFAKMDGIIYSEFTNPLEAIREELSRWAARRGADTTVFAPAEWYKRLLGVPLAEREAFVRAYADELIPSGASSLEPFFRRLRSKALGGTL